MKCSRPRRHGKLFSPILFFSLLVPLGCFAQDEEEPPRFEPFVQGGGSFYASRSRTFTSPQFLRFTTSFSKSGRLFTGLRFYLSRRDALEASYSYSPNGMRLTTADSSSSVTTVVPMKVHHLAFNYIRYFSRRGRTQPFVTGGLGLAAFLEESGGPVEVAGNFGGGFDVRLNSRMSLRTEWRDFFSRADPTDRIYHNFVPSVGLVFRLR